MGFLDRLLGRGNQERSDDEIAIERYEYLLRTAPPETIEQVHTKPATLAKAATRAELQQPGIRTRTLGGSAFGGSVQGGPSFGGMVGSSLLGSVAGYVIGSTLVSAFMPSDFGGDFGF